MKFEHNNNVYYIRWDYLVESGSGKYKRGKFFLRDVKNKRIKTTCSLSERTQGGLMGLTEQQVIRHRPDPFDKSLGRRLSLVKVCDHVAKVFKDESLSDKIYDVFIQTVKEYKDVECEF